MQFLITKINRAEAAVCALAELGTEKKILYALAHRRKDNVSHNWKDLPYARKFRRGQGGWAKSVTGRLMADRLLSLYRKMYKDTQLDRPISALQLLNLYFAYNGLYPNSEIHPTRIFYFFPLIREQLLGIIPACECCSKPHIVHYDDNSDVQLCASCTLSGVKIVKTSSITKSQFPQGEINEEILEYTPQLQQL